MNIEEIILHKDQIYRIAAKYHITKVYVFGSIARGESDKTSDADFLIEMEKGASAFGVGGFQYEVEQLLGINIDVIPKNVIPDIVDREFVKNINAEAVAL